MPYGVIILMWGLLSFTMSFIYYPCVKKFILCNVNEHVSASDKEQKKRKRTHDSSKLWHWHLGHISRGRIERLVKNEILPPLEFSDIEQCIDCIKRKFEIGRASCRERVFRAV